MSGTEWALVGCCVAVVGSGLVYGYCLGRFWAWVYEGGCDDGDVA
jgi:hypothetical protein